jgi:hypothetical protein
VLIRGAAEQTQRTVESVCEEIARGREVTLTSDQTRE